MLRNRQGLKDGVVSAGEWIRVGQAVRSDIVMDSKLYETRVLEDVIDVGEHANLGELVRARVAEQIEKRLVEREYGV